MANLTLPLVSSPADHPDGDAQRDDAGRQDANENVTLSLIHISEPTRPY